MTTRPRCAGLLSRLHAILALALLAVAAAPVPAQFVGAGADFGAMGMTRVGRKSVQGYAKLVGMDQAQADAAMALQEGYAESHRALTKQFQADMQKIQEEFQDTQDFSVFQKKMPKMAKEFGEKMEALEKGFMSDIRALLTPAQETAWPKVERMRRRETGLRVSMVSGQGVDLVDVLGDLKVDPSASPDLADQLDRYELDMDKKLVAMEEWGKEQQKAWTDQEDAFDFSKMSEMMKKAEEMMKEMSEQSKSIRDVNRQYTRTLLPLVPADQQAKFDHEVKRRSFPRVYRTPWVSKAMTAADGFGDANAEQKAALAELRGGYDRELAAANAKWAAAIEAREEKTGGSMLAMMQAMQGGETGGDEISEARQARKDLDDRYKDKLGTLLNADQKSRLPEEKSDPHQQADFMGMMGVDDLEGEEDDESEEDPG